MDEYLHSRYKEAFLKLLTDPADTGAEYLVNLQELVKAYPQSGIFRAMYGRALNETNPIVAGGYFDNLALHKLLYHYDSLLPVEAKQVILQGNKNEYTDFTVVREEISETAATNVPEPAVQQNNSKETLIDLPANYPETSKSDGPATQTEEAKLLEESKYPVTLTDTFTEPVIEKQETTVEEEPLGRAPWELDDDDEELPEVAAITPQEQTAPSAEALAVESTPQPFIDNVEDEVTEPAPDVKELTPWDLIAEEYAAQAARSNEQVRQEKAVETKAGNYIDEEIFDEITGIENITITRPLMGVAVEPDAVKQVESIENNTAGTNYFSFDPSFTEQFNEGTLTTEPAAHEGVELNETDSDEKVTQNEVSRYHDEKMPYTFMWWLDKTRKEHDATYQPYTKAPGNNYVNKPVKKPRPDELQQQYIENIFHLSPPDSLNNTDEPQTVEFDMQVKEDRIIKRFITEDPHIHPPVGEKLDTENKAKRSSEDDFEMVTETLARIYTDQMLFPKAIATYRKLMLKFPEKSRYFASRIDALEKRTN